MAESEKAEDAPENTEEEHPQDVARREGVRLNPQWQIEHLDTSGDVATDIHRISPVFAVAREHAVRSAAAAADAEYPPDNVVFPDDKDEADTAREHARKMAADLPEEPEPIPPGYADGMGGPYGQGIVPAPDETAKTDEKTDGDEKTEGAKSTPAKAPAKSTGSTSRTSTAKTTSK